MNKKTKKTRRRNCRPPYYISEAGHLLSTRGTSKAGRTLSHDGKAAQKKRKKRGCLNGTGDSFQLTSKQKRNLPKALQQAIIAYHRRLGKRIIA